MRVLIAMSGGVDSAVAAHRILAAGHEAEGCTLILGDARGEDARAAAVCRRLGIPHRTLDLTREFAAEVVHPFALAYAEGRTPNPCIECNRRIKFGRLLDYALREGFDALATGHYARLVGEGEGRRVARAADARKDQSYVLYHLSPEALSHVLFPLGEMEKSEVKALAASLGLVESAEARESQDICFVPDGDYASLVERETGCPSLPGNYVDAEGRVLGPHRGIIHYTVGQHKGLGIALGRVRYVTAISAARREVTLGDAEDLYRREVALSDLVLHGASGAPFRAAVKLRYRAPDAMATVIPEGKGALLVFDTPQRAPAPGQSAVLYDGDTVLGGGTIL